MPTAKPMPELAPVMRTVCPDRTGPRGGRYSSGPSQRPKTTPTPARVPMAAPHPPCERLARNGSQSKRAARPTRHEVKIRCGVRARPRSTRASATMRAIAISSTHRAKQIVARMPQPTTAAAIPRGPDLEVYPSCLSHGFTISLTKGPDRGDPRGLREGER
eukprot:scaffold50_cov107-Isochrysis_galbana.AAC.8